MKKPQINHLALFIALIAICLSCRKEHVSPINQLVKDLFCFKTGSEWIYYDSLSHTTHKMVVTNYEIRQFAPESKGGRKIYDYAESIYIDLIIDGDSPSTSLKCRTWLLADIDYDNTLVGMYISTPLIDNTLRCRTISLHCDENNNFSPSATYLNTYVINGITYSDVYVFNVDNATYYVSKHTGFIRCVENNYFDYVLIDKNVLQ